MKLPDQCVVGLGVVVLKETKIMAISAALLQAWVEMHVAIAYLRKLRLYVK